MKKYRKGWLALLAGLWAWGATDLIAGEGYKERGTGVTVLLGEVGLTSDEIDSWNEQTIDINRTVHMVGQAPEWVTLASNAAEMTSFVQNLTFSVGMWDNLPTARLDFAIGALRTINSDFLRDGMNVATLAGGTYAFDGQGGGHLIRGDYNLPEIGEFDVILRRGVNLNDANRSRVVLTQEVGHGIGFNHSWLDRESVRAFTAAASRLSLMSYSNGGNTVIAAGALNPDDVAVASRLYYNPYNPLSRNTGTVQGVALDAGGTSEIYGANVLLVDRANGQAILSRISGYATSRPSGAKNGQFALDGVPAGSYDILVAARDDAQVPNSNPDMGYMELRSDGSTDWPDALASFASGFGRAWVRNVPVQAGETVDVGDVLAGVDRGFDQPSRMDLTVKSPRTGFSRYWYDFWSSAPWQMAHRSGSQAGSSYTLPRMTPGSYAVKVFGWNGASWVVVQDWTWRDFTPRRASVTWNRATRTLNLIIIQLRLEVYSYVVQLRDSASGISISRPVHGNRYTTHRFPGAHDSRVTAQWNTSVGAFEHQAWTAFQVP